MLKGAFIWHSGLGGCKIIHDHTGPRHTPRRLALRAGTLASSGPLRASPDDHGHALVRQALAQGRVLRCAPCRTRWNAITMVR